MNAKNFPFICGCGYNTMDAKSASEHIATCHRLDDDPDSDTPKPSHTAEPHEEQVIASVVLRIKHLDLKYYNQLKAHDALVGALGGEGYPSFAITLPRLLSYMAGVIQTMSRELVGDKHNPAFVDQVREISDKLNSALKQAGEAV